MDGVALSRIPDQRSVADCHSLVTSEGMLRCVYFYREKRLTSLLHPSSDEQGQRQERGWWYAMVCS